jgi:hypothetical protein
MRAVLIALLLIPVAAHAEDDTPEKAQARTLLGQGNALFEKGDLRGALVNFRAAYALYPSPKLLVNAAAAERELGDLPGAANDLRHFLDEASDSGDDPFLVDKAKQDLRAVERKCGRIAFPGWPAKSSFDVDGHALRDPAYVRPGEHHVHGRTPGGAELDREVSVSAGDEAVVAAPPAAANEPVATTTSSTVKKKTRWWIPVVVTTVLLVAAGAGVGLGVGLTQQSRTPLAGDLGSYPFSSFH